jgi:hypothetical protein
MTSRLGMFKQQLNRTINDLEQWVTDVELEKAKLKITTALKINIRGSVEMFMESISVYAPQILDGDERFFLNLNIDKELDSHDVENKNEMSSELNRIRSRVKFYWNKLDKKQHNQLKNHFKLLVMLGTLATRNESVLIEINKRRSPDNPLSF